MTSWVNGWLGIPWAEGARGPEAYDCMGLMIAVTEARTGVRLPDPLARGVSHDEAWRANRYERIGLDDVSEGDALLFRGLARGGLHIGYALDGWDMLHVGGDGYTAHPPSRVETWRSAAWMRRMEGAYRVCHST